MQNAALSVAVVPPRAYVRLQGRGSFQVSPALKKFAVSAMQQGCTTFIIDLNACEGMDSTFMGVLAGIAMRLRKDVAGGEVIAVNLDAKNNSLLETLGLGKVMQLISAPLSEAQQRQYGVTADHDGMRPLDTRAADRSTTAETMLSAHQDLIAAAPENQPRFQDVLTYLKKDMQGKTADEQAES